MPRLTKWERELKDLVLNPWDHPGDPDHPTCPDCGATMDFHGHDDSGDFPLGEGYWVCSGCGFKVTEDDLY